ncbi:DUF4212 domain-containing protein [Altererythrobacter sp.]|uniref:DUF4212 domain-containing protein n=1 Tax=Altererythrobacter sp. TaxID=1872480 RepID=UPI003D08E78B
MDQQGENPDEVNARGYWHANLRLLGILMSIWFLASFGAGILFRPFLDQFTIGGFPLGFWFAQQGSIYVFIALIFFYTWKMHRIDREHGVDDD